MTAPVCVFFGSDAICLPILNAIMATPDRLNLRAVVSQPDRRQGRGKKMSSNPVAAWAKKNGIELLQPEKPGVELAQWMQQQSTAIALVMAYGHFLNRALREAPTVGMYNFHASLLPKYRGAAPIEWAIADGERETGVALMQVVQAMDAGEVAAVERVEIEPADVAAAVRDKVGQAVVPLFERCVQAGLLRQELAFEPQDAALATHARKLVKADGLIDFTLPVATVHNRIRAFSTWPGSFFNYQSVPIKVGRSEWRQTQHALKFGTVLSAGDALCVAVRGGIISFRELQRPGGRLLPAIEFLRGFSIGPGDLLTG